MEHSIILGCHGKQSMYSFTVERPWILSFFFSNETEETIRNLFDWSCYCGAIPRNSPRLLFICWIAFRLGLFLPFITSLFCLLSRGFKRFCCVSIGITTTILYLCLCKRLSPDSWPVFDQLVFRQPPTALLPPSPILPSFLMFHHTFSSRFSRHLAKKKTR